MATNETTSKDIYAEVLARLRKVGAAALADEIERTVARGVVVPQPESKLYQKSTVLRPTTDDEKLATAIEFITTAAEIPLMLERVRSAVGGADVKWLPERLGTEREEVSMVPIQGAKKLDIDKASKLLTEIIAIADDHKLNLPEIA